VSNGKGVRVEDGRGVGVVLGMDCKEVGCARFRAERSAARWSAGVTGRKTEVTGVFRAADHAFAPAGEAFSGRPASCTMSGMGTQRLAGTVILGLLLLLLLVGAWLAGPATTLLPDPMLAP
jgi:hypothetical protein